MQIFRSLRLIVVVVLFAGELCAQTPPLEMLHRPAPAFALHDLSGRKIKLRTYRGKVVLLNFWATWCAPCQAELPRFDEWQKRYGALGFQVLAVSMDDNAPPVRRTVSRLHLDFPVMMGDARLGSKYGGVLGLPVTYLIDRDGSIVAEFKAEADLNAIEGEVQRALAGPQLP